MRKEQSPEHLDQVRGLGGDPTRFPPLVLNHMSCPLTGYYRNGRCHLDLLIITWQTRSMQCGLGGGRSTCSEKGRTVKVCVAA